MLLTPKGIGTYSHTDTEFKIMKVSLLFKESTEVELDSIDVPGYTCLQKCGSVSTLAPQNNVTCV